MITDGSHPSHMDPDPAQTPSSTALQSTTQQPCPGAVGIAERAGRVGQSREDQVVVLLDVHPALRLSHHRELLEPGDRWRRCATRHASRSFAACPSSRYEKAFSALAGSNRSLTVN